MTRIFFHFTFSLAGEHTLENFSFFYSVIRFHVCVHVHVCLCVLTAGYVVSTIPLVDTWTCGGAQALAEFLCKLLLQSLK